MTKEEREAFIKWAVNDHEGWFIAWTVIGSCCLVPALILGLCALWLPFVIVLAGGAFWPFALIGLNSVLLGARSIASPSMRKRRKEQREEAAHIEKMRKANLTARRHAELEATLNV